MNWGSWSAFLSMGGHGRYVRGAYGVTVLATGLEIWALARRSRAARGAAG